MTKEILRALIVLFCCRVGFLKAVSRIKLCEKRQLRRVSGHTFDRALAGQTGKVTHLN